MNKKMLWIIAVVVFVGAGAYFALNRQSVSPSPIAPSKETMPPFLFGMNPIRYLDGPTEKELKDMASLGVKSIRIWVNWRKIEPKKGELDWSSLDKLVAQSEQKGMKPWFLVAGAPQHACKGGQLDEQMDRLCPPKIEPYKIFLAKLVERYQGRIRYYEIWNEPDDEYYWITGTNAAEYAELLQVSYDIIKGIDNNIQVVMAATAGTNLPFMREVLDHLGGKPAFDAIASHPYRPSPEPPHYFTVGPDERSWRELPEGGGAGVEVNLKEELLLYKKLLEDYGYENVPHWITEFGYPGHGGRASAAYLTLEQQADFLRRTIELLRDDPELKFVKGVFWWTDRDLDIDIPDPIPLDWFAYFGLIAADGTWKPAAKVFKELATRQPEEPEWRIRINALDKLGPSRIDRFMYIQGSPLLASDAQGSNEDSRQFEIAAWKALDLTSITTLIDGEVDGQGITVIRSATPLSNLIGPLGPKKDLYLDTSQFDAMQDFYRDTLGSNEGFRRTFEIVYMPRTLSSNPSAENYYMYPPKDYTEWRAVLGAAVRYLNKQGIDDPYIILFGEPESSIIFNVLDPATGAPFPHFTEPVLREYVRFFAESQRAVKAADRGAKVSAMCASVYSADLFRELRQNPEEKGLDDFIAYLAEYNQALPPGAKPAELDNICWQGYSWKDEKSMAHMVEYIRSVLERYGFSGAAPHYLYGWSGGWASPRTQHESYPLNLYAPHLIYNVIDLINPGGKPGPIKEGYYYTWNLDFVYESGVTENSSLVRTVHEQIAYDQVYGSVASDQNCLRPAYVAFQALKLIEGGEVLAMKETRPHLTRSIATADKTGLRVLLVNYTNKAQRAQLIIEHVPKTARLDEAVLRRVPEDEICGDGNWFPSNNPMSIFLNESVKLTQEKNGDISISVSMAPNTVALLEIPSGR
jgi:hypothetical protein